MLQDPNDPRSEWPCSFPLNILGSIDVLGQRRVGMPPPAKLGASSSSVLCRVSPMTNTADVAMAEVPRELGIAVSRRFNHRDVDELFAQRIEPVLVRFGTVLRCDFASDSADDLDYWMNRMNVVLDLADVHVFIDVDRSA